MGATLFGFTRRGDAGFQELVETGLNAGGGKNGRRTCQQPQDTRRRFVVERKIERRRVAKPTLDRAAEVFLDVPANLEGRRRARAAVTVFIRAADGKFGATGVNIDGHCALRMTEIPEHPSAGFMDFRVVSMSG